MKKTTLRQAALLFLFIANASMANPADAAEVPSAPQAALRQHEAAQRAYASYLVGELESSREAYVRILQRSPKHTYSLNALGMIAVRQQDFALARSYFKRVLLIDPQDSIALAQIALLQPSDKPPANLLAQHGDAAVSYFVYGIRQAQRGRWQEAQANFFKAYERDTDNPDVLNNLAVSLDQLGRHELAESFYRQAIAAAKSRPASFDRAALQVRLAQTSHQEPQP